MQRDDGKTDDHKQRHSVIEPGTRKPDSRTRPPRVEPGKLREIAHLERAGAGQLLQSALVRICGGDADSDKRGVLWRDGDDELVLHPGRAALATAERLIVVTIPVYTDQTGDAEVVVPFVTNPSESALGLIAATETKPRGPAPIIDVFGDALVAAAWAALVETVASWAADAGETAGHGRLAPAGLAATKSALLVSAQQRLEP